MPEFQMNDSEARDFRALDEFTQGYIEALFFTDEEPGTERAVCGRCDRPVEAVDGKCPHCGNADLDVPRNLWDPENQSSLPGDVGFLDIAPEALERIENDCAQFRSRHGALLEEATAYDYDMTQAGRDFWYTRNGHGVGFWDRYDEIRDEHLRDALTDAAKAFGEVWTTLGDDGKVYVQ